MGDAVVYKKVYKNLLPFIARNIILQKKWNNTLEVSGKINKYNWKIGKGKKIDKKTGFPSKAGTL